MVRRNAQVDKLPLNLSARLREAEKRSPV